MVTDVIASRLAARATGEVIESLGGRRPVGPVNDNERLFADSHLHERCVLAALQTPGAGRSMMIAHSRIT